jgi:6-phosphogluconolactonase
VGKNGSNRAFGSKSTTAIPGLASCSLCRTNVQYDNYPFCSKSSRTIRARTEMRRKSLLRFAVTFAYLLLAGGAAQVWASSSERAYLAFVGTLTGRSAIGIYAYRFHPAGAHTEFLGLAAKTPAPTFLAVHPSQKFLYAVNETAGKDRAGGNTVTAFRIDDRTAKLLTLNTVPSGGTGPCHAAVSGDGKVLVVTNCGSGSVAAFPIREDGSLAYASVVLQHQGSSVNPQRQKGPHAHGVVITPDSTKAFVADLGLDKIFIYRLNSGSGSIEPSDPPTASLSPGAGVRHLALDLSGNFLYALSELDSAITVFRCSRHAVRQIQLISALPHDAPPQIGGSEIELDAKGAFLYTSIRGAQNMIAVFAVDRNNGRLTAVQHISSGGRTPRHFAIDPTHAFLFAANQNSHSIAIFAIGADGRLRPTHRFLDDVESPACIVFVEPHHG